MPITPCAGAAYSISTTGREMISHGTSLFPIAFYNDDLERDRVPWHWHDELEAVYIPSGETVVRTGTARYVLRAGQGFFINTDVLHSAIGTRGTGCRYHSMVFHPRLVGGDVDSIFWQKYVKPLMAGGPSIAFDCTQAWHREALDAIEDAWQEGAAGSAGYEFRVRSALSRLVFLTVSHMPEEKHRVTEKEARDGERIKQMLQFVQAHYAEELTLAQIAASASLSESECLRCFRSTIGVAPVQYLKRCRVQKAAEMLTATDEKIADIGEMCGFQDTSYFIRAFREIKGMTPGQYRAQALGAQAQGANAQALAQ